MVAKALAWLLFAGIVLPSISCANRSNDTFDLDTWKRVVEKFIDDYDDEDLCTKNLASLIEHLDDDYELPYNSRHYFDSWIKTTMKDLQTLKVLQIMTKDIQCKLHRPNTTRTWHPNRYCTQRRPYNSTTGGDFVGFCTPNECSEKHAETLARLLLNSTNDEGEEADDLKCSTGQHEEYEIGFYVTVVVGALAIVLSVTGTISDCPKHDKHEKGEGEHEDDDSPSLFAQIFSLQSNFKKLVRRSSATTIDAFHFIKVGAMTSIILGQSYILTQVFAENVEDYREANRGKIVWQLFFNNSYLLGIFFTIGGALHVYSTLTKLAGSRFDADNGGRRRFSLATWICMIINRYIRIIPIYLYSILVVTYLMPYLIEYRLWYPIDQAEQCPSQIWRHLLFINNFKELQLCMPWTWYMAVDFQLFLVCTPIVALYLHRPRSAVLTCLAIIVASCTARVVLVLFNDYPPAPMLLLPLNQYNTNIRGYNFDVFNRPYVWASSYAIGMLSGYFAYYAKYVKLIEFPALLHVLFYIVAVFGLFWAPLGLYWTANGFKSFVYDGLYVGLSPVLQSLLWGWIAVQCHCYLKHSIVNIFLRFKFWIVLSNLTYACYLVHFPFAFGLMSRYALDQGGRPRINMTSNDLYGLFVCALLLSYLLSLFLYLLIEGPASSFQNLILKRIAECVEGRGCRRSNSERERKKLFDRQYTEIPESPRYF